MWYIRLTRDNTSLEERIGIYQELLQRGDLKWEVWPDGDIYLESIDALKWRSDIIGYPEVYSKKTRESIPGTTLGIIPHSKGMLWFRRTAPLDQNSIGVDPVKKLIVVRPTPGNTEELTEEARDLASGTLVEAGYKYLVMRKT